MTSKPIVVWTFLYLAIIQTQSNTPPEEDLQDEYYTIAATYTDKFQPSDERDAQTILGGGKDDKVKASIFLYREKIRRNAISKKIWNHLQKSMNDSVSLDKRTLMNSDQWITQAYLPQLENNPFLDLWYGLVYDENVVLSGYLNNFFMDMYEKLINIALVLTKDMQTMINTYGPDQFKKARKKQITHFEHMLRVWVRCNREPLEQNELNPEDVKQNADALKKEQDNGGWHENRDQLELITMRKSIKFARAVIAEFEKLNKERALEDILIENIKACGLDKNLADTYASLVRYIKCKHKYIAQIMAENCNGWDEWAVWIMCIAVVHPQEWPKIDDAFKNDHNGVSLSEFILKTLAANRTLSEVFAVAVNSKFKPTTFTERPMDNRPLSLSPGSPTKSPSSP